MRQTQGSGVLLGVSTPSWLPQQADSFSSLLDQPLAWWLLALVLLLVAGLGYWRRRRGSGGGDLGDDQL